MYRHGYEDFYESIRLGNFLNVKYTIENGFDFEKDSFKAFFLSVHHNRKKIARLLKEQYEKYYELNREFRSVLCVAMDSCVGNNNIEMASFLASEFNVARHSSYVERAVYNDYIEMTRFLLSDSFFAWGSGKCYVYAVNNGSFEMARLLVQKHVSIAGKEEEIINACIEQKQMDILKYLMEEKKESFDKADLSGVFK